MKIEREYEVRTRPWLNDDGDGEDEGLVDQAHVANQAHFVGCGLVVKYFCFLINSQSTSYLSTGFSPTLVSYYL
jgi:hypothetical protein